MREGERRVDVTETLADAEIKLIRIWRLDLVREHPNGATNPLRRRDRPQT